MGQTEFLRKEIEEILITVSAAAGFRKMVTEPLMKSKRGLAAANPDGGSWPLLPNRI